MFAFKKADLEAEKENLSGYTAAPPHSLKSITSGAMRFMDHTMGQKHVPARLVYGGANEYDRALGGLQFELNSYLSEPPMELFKAIQGPEPEPQVFCCDPLRYWMVCIFPYFSAHFSLIYVGCSEKVPIPLSTCNGHPSSPSICSCL